MSEKRTSVFSNGLIWFGAGVSLAEILTGTYFAPLGFGRAMAAILLGHLIGGLMMFAAGMIGAKERKSAMETVKMSFGEKGSLLFAVLNVLQLVGWTSQQTACYIAAYGSLFLRSSAIRVTTSCKFPSAVIFSTASLLPVLSLFRLVAF